MSGEEVDAHIPTQTAAEAMISSLSTSYPPPLHATRGIDVVGDDDEGDRLTMEMFRACAVPGTVCECVSEGALVGGWLVGCAWVHRCTCSVWVCV